MSRKSTKLPVHHYRLRPDCTVRLDLPADLTRHETRRLAMLLASLVLEEVWPDITSDDGEFDDFDEKDDDELDLNEVKAYFDSRGIVDDLCDPVEEVPDISMTPPSKPLKKAAKTRSRR